MRSVSVRLADLDRVKINLGIAGENEHTHVLFDCKKAFDQYPNATPFLIVTPPRGDIYPAVVTRDGDIVEWVVTDSDLIYHGNGKVQLQFKQGDIIMKSYEARTSIAISSEPTGTVPTPIQNWITQANAILASIPDDIAAALAAAKASGEFDGADGVGIAAITYKSTVGLVDTYTITLTDGRDYDFTVTNGKDGDDGDDGVGIQSIAKTGTVGLVDTYTITLTNGQEYTFTVTNGQGSSIVIDDVTPASDKVFSSAKVAEELTDVKTAIQGKQDAPSTAGTSGQVLSLDNNLHPVWVSPSTASIEDGSVTKQKLSSDVVAELNTVEEASGHYENRLLNYDGTIVPPKYKAGLIRYVSNGTEASGSNNKRMSFASGQYLSLKKGDTVNRDNTWILEFGGGYYTDNMTVLHAIEGTTLQYTCPADGDYFFWTTKKAEAVFTPEDEANAYNALIFNREPNTVKTVSDMKTNVDGMVSIPTTLSDGYYSDVGTVQSPSTSKEKYTQKYNVVSGMTLKVILQFIESAHASWVAACEWLNDGTFYRRTLTSATAMLLNLTYTPGSNVKQVAFTFRGFDDYELTITTSNIAFLAMVSGNVVVYDPVTYDFDSHRVKGINHRGFYTAPENTIPAYQKSVEEGFKFVETDVRFTSDGVPVLLHDESINRTARNSDGTEISGTVNIASITYAQALEYDFGIAVSSTYAGTKIPTFEQFIVFCRNKGLFPYIEISGGSFTSAQVLSLVEIVKKYNMQRAVTWISFYHNNLMKVVAYDPCARVGRLPSGDSITAEITKATELRTGRNEVFINLSSSGIDSTRLNLCVTLGLPLETWTINAEADMLALDDYISGVTSDQLNFEKVLYDN